MTDDSNDVELKPSRETQVEQKKEADPAPPGKTIHPRRPLPTVPEKKPDE
jgi:hypothetical protein